MEYKTIRIPQPTVYGEMSELMSELIKDAREYDIWKGNIAAVNKAVKKEHQAILERVAMKFEDELISAGLDNTRVDLVSDNTYRFSLSNIHSDSHVGYLFLSIRSLGSHKEFNKNGVSDGRNEFDGEWKIMLRGNTDAVRVVDNSNGDYTSDKQDAVRNIIDKSRGMIMKCFIKTEK